MSTPNPSAAPRVWNPTARRVATLAVLLALTPTAHAQLNRAPTVWDTWGEDAIVAWDPSTSSVPFEEWLVLPPSAADASPTGHGPATDADGLSRAYVALVSGIDARAMEAFLEATQSPFRPRVSPDRDNDRHEAPMTAKIARAPDDPGRVFESTEPVPLPAAGTLGHPRFNQLPTPVAPLGGAGSPGKPPSLQLETDRPLSETQLSLRPRVIEQGGGDQNYLPDDEKPMILYDQSPAVGSGNVQFGGSYLFGWEAPNFFHRPLYFEDKNLERYGHYHCSWKLQSAISATHFLLMTAALPVSAICCPPSRCVHSLGHWRPGNCNPNVGYRLVGPCEP